jgi:Uma2 family endonuclease
MAQAAPVSINVEQFFEMPEGGPRYELVEGELFMMPPPNLFHQSISINLAALIKGYLRKERIGKVWCAPIGVILSEDVVLQPDVVFVSSERKSLLSDRGIEGAPDFVTEILSPGTERYDRGAKRSLYARFGVTEMWLIDPKRKEISVFHLQQDSDKPAAVHGGKDQFECMTFPKLTFDCAQIFEP